MQSVASQEPVNNSNDILSPNDTQIIQKDLSHHSKEEESKLITSELNYSKKMPSQNYSSGSNLGVSQKKQNGGNDKIIIIKKSPS